MPTASDTRLSITQVRLVRCERLRENPPTFDELARRLDCMPITIYRAVYGIGVGYARITDPAPLEPGKRGKFTTEDAERMRALRRARWSLRRIAREFNTNQTTVWSRVRDVVV